MRWPFKFTLDAYLLRYRPKEYAISKAHYYLKDEALKRELNRINKEFKDIKEKEYLLNELDIDLEYGHITLYEYDHKCNEINNSDDKKQYELNRVEIEFKHSKIKDYEYECDIANINEEPFMKIINSDVNWETKEFSYKPIWNSYFIEWLKDIGYSLQSDITEEDLVDAYIKDVFCSPLLEEIEQLEEDEISTLEEKGDMQVERIGLIQKEKSKTNPNMTVYS